MSQLRHSSSSKSPITGHRRHRSRLSLRLHPVYASSSPKRCLHGSSVKRALRRLLERGHDEHESSHHQHGDSTIQVFYFSPT